MMIPILIAAPWVIVALSSGRNGLRDLAGWVVLGTTVEGVVAVVAWCVVIDPVDRSFLAIGPALTVLGWVLFAIGKCLGPTHEVQRG